MARRMKKEDAVETKVEETKVDDNKVEDEKDIDPKGLTPAEYFSKIKELRKDNMPENLKKGIEVCENLVSKFEAVGQKKAIEKLMYKIKILEKEIELYNRGIKTYVLLEDVTKYVKKISDKNVFLTSLE